MKTVCRVYDSYAQARAAVDARAEERACPPSDVSIVANKYVSAEHADVDEVSEAAKGAGIGGALGGGAGLLAGLGLLAIPGLGPVVAAGWLAVHRRGRRRRRGDRRHRRRAGRCRRRPRACRRLLRVGAPRRHHGDGARALTRTPAASPRCWRAYKPDRSGGARRRVPQDGLADVRREGSALPAEPGRDRPHAGELAGLRTTGTRTRAGAKPALRRCDPHCPFNGEAQ